MDYWIRTERDSTLPFTCVSGHTCVMMIYVIDDHPIMREAIAMVLRRLRPDMHIVELGRLLELEPIKDAPTPPSVIFLDLNLPDANGCSGVFQVKTKFPTVPLAVYSASPSLEMEQSCLEAGANMYVEKTADLKALASALDGLLCNPCAQDESLRKYSRTTSSQHRHTP